MRSKWLTAAALLVFGAAGARADVKTQTVTYEYGGVTFKGHLAWDDAAKGKRPGVLVLHEWWGLNDYAKKRSEQLAALGYVAFAGDMYGGGKVVEHPKDAGAMAGAVRKDVKIWQGRAQAALKILQGHELVDPKRIAAIGYCFGGSTALQLAYSGADLAAVATFHAALPIPEPEQARAIKPKLLICHGAADPFIPEATAQKFRAALDEAKVDYEFIYFGRAVHSFTVPTADKVGLKGMGYNAEADRRSWQAMRELFNEVFGARK